MELNNGILDFEGTRVRVLGDPHLGRRFRTGVPIHRLGEREESVWETFANSLLNDDNDIHICMGDIFDKYTVSSEVLLETYRIYSDASRMFPEKNYYIIQGNHDLSRDTDRASSLDVLEELFESSPNLHVVKTPQVVSANELEFLLVPYHAFKQGAEVIREAYESLVEPNNHYIEAAFGHWDIETFGGTRPHNLVDMHLLGWFTRVVVTGHVHQPEVRKVPHAEGEMTLIVTGSMQPYSFAEDLTEDLYITTTLEDYLKLPPEGLKDKCVRLLLKPNEELPELDCLQLVAKFVTEDGEEDSIEVELIDFNMETLLRESLTESDVSATIQEEIIEIYQVAREAVQ